MNRVDRKIGTGLCGLTVLAGAALGGLLGAQAVGDAAGAFGPLAGALAGAAPGAVLLWLVLRTRKG